MPVRLISAEQVRSLLNLERTIEVVEDAFAQYARGQTVTPPVLCLPVAAQRGEIDAKICYMDGLGIAGGKVVSFYEGNAAKGLPSVLGTILLFDGTTGELLAVMDGGYITRLRTGALGALSVKYLARADAKLVAVIGAGTQARIQLEALKLVKPGIGQVRAFSRTPANTQAYAKEMQEKLGIPVHVVSSVREAVEGADIIITATNASEPLVKEAWVSAGTHIVDIGADGEGMQELDPALFKRARAFCDSLAQCAAIGELQHPLKAGILTREQVTEIGNVLIGAAPGRQRDDEITIFDSTGVAIQDLATGHLVYQLAEAADIGTVVELTSNSSPRLTLRYLGETLDHLACSTMAFQDWPRHAQLPTFYQAARQLAEGDPISWRMGKALLKALVSNKTVLVATGEYEPNEFKHGESDGPVGIAVLARVLVKLGCRVVLVCDPHLFDVHRSVVDQFVGAPLEYVAFPGSTDFDYKALAARILEQCNPAALIACEKLSRNSVGEYHAASGMNCSTHENRVDYLFDLAFEQGRLTLGFGDHGNEIGFGSIREAALEISPWGKKCQCPCGQGIIATTQTTYLLPATVSNWGAIAVANMLAALTNRPDLVHTEGRQRWLQELLLEYQVIDGAFRRVSRSVDSVEGDVDLAIVKVMEAATARILATKAAYLARVLK
jgi:ornithine cyclodeaminase/alanine dehydrogenase